MLGKEHLQPAVLALLKRPEDRRARTRPRPSANAQSPETSASRPRCRSPASMNGAVGIEAAHRLERPPGVERPAGRVRDHVSRCRCGRRRASAGARNGTSAPHCAATSPISSSSVDTRTCSKSPEARAVSMTRRSSAGRRTAGCSCAECAGCRRAPESRRSSRVDGLGHRGDHRVLLRRRPDRGNIGRLMASA